MLRCEGCGVMHHPGCWVTNGGCATQVEHRVAPQAMAYTTGARPPGTPAPHPGEGTRATPLPPPPHSETPEPIPFRPLGRPQHPPAATEPAPPGGEPVIGEPPPAIHRRLPENEIPPAAPPRRYVPPTGEQMVRKPLPRIYERHKIVAYWYVPVAVALAVVVAFGVIWGAEKLFGGDADKASPEPTPAATTGGAVGAQTPSPAATTPAATTTTPPATVTTGPGKFSLGDTLVVTGTGDCLNVRTNPGVENDAIVCIADATEVKVTGGPEESGGLTWWKVETRLGEGWAAEDYLVKKP